MCNDFSLWVTQSGNAIWKRGISSHDALFSRFKNDFPELQERGTSNPRAVKIEITPDGGYLYPEKPWSLRVDDSDSPDWFTSKHERFAWKAHEQWMNETYALINLKEARNPINPLKAQKTYTKKDIELLKEWASVWNLVRASILYAARASVWDSVGASVRASVWDSVGASILYAARASVWDSVGASVRAYLGSLFDIWNGKYKFQSCVDLWKRGFVPSFDGKLWRLHSGKDAQIIWEGKI